MRLIELQNEADSVQACRAIGRTVPDANLRGWAALVPAGLPALTEGLRQSGLPVLTGATGALALGSIGQIWLAARSLADALDREPLRDAARDLLRRAESVESPAAASTWQLPRTRLPQGRTLVMGVVNATPDSFSDGGAYDPVKRGLRLAEEGADILDVGGESTRPNAAPVDAAEERRRTESVVRELARQTRLPISIDTTKASVAAAALDAGAEIVNDVSGLARDPELAPRSGPRIRQDGCPQSDAPAPPAGAHPARPAPGAGRLPQVLHRGCYGQGRSRPADRERGRRRDWGVERGSGVTGA